VPWCRGSRNAGPVNPTIFFLIQNGPALLAARDAMAQFGYSPNLSVVENFIACFGRTYQDAYSGCKNGS